MVSTRDEDWLMVIQAGETAAAVGAGGSCRIACGKLHLQSSQFQETCLFSMFFTMKSAKKHNFSLLNDCTGSQPWALRKVYIYIFFTYLCIIYNFYLNQFAWQSFQYRRWLFSLVCRKRLHRSNCQRCSGCLAGGLPGQEGQGIEGQTTKTQAIETTDEEKQQPGKMS